MNKTLVIQNKNSKWHENSSDGGFFAIDLDLVQSKKTLKIYFKNQKEISLNSNLLVIDGWDSSNNNEDNIIFKYAKSGAISESEDWENFLIQHLTSKGLNVQLIKTEKEQIIRPLLENYYVSFAISKDRMRLLKAEFEFLNSANFSCAKGIFVNNNPEKLQFIQTSCLGESDKKFEFDFNSKSQKDLIEFLKIPFEEGWTEKQFYFGKEAFYKCQVATSKFKRIWEFVILDFAEQDIPLGFDTLVMHSTLILSNILPFSFFEKIKKIRVKPILTSTNNKI